MISRHHTAHYNSGIFSFIGGAPNHTIGFVCPVKITFVAVYLQSYGNFSLTNEINL